MNLKVVCNKESGGHLTGISSGSRCRGRSGVNPAGYARPPMTPADFQALVTRVTDAIRGRPLDDGLRAHLNATFGPESDTYRELSEACRSGSEAGFLCAREHGGVRYGRVIEASDATAGYSVDVVHMKDVKGPYHRHPNGEIDLVMPLSDGAQFDGHGAGWVVYGAESAHYPTVTNGEAFVLYLLPGGAIDFKARPPAS